ncbi:titin-like isoform X1 [Dermacentor silvarum]|uniref:titin-like isoform X1 n=1 Tax=Dermacentor silvarum TaxID=543639 RepID=UPI00210134FD|nr:titin-like isoform X1 [Dermacentor silvarum]
MGDWEYNCPKYVNLASSAEESVDQLEQYFEVDHEEEQTFRRMTRSASAALAASAGAPAGAQTQQPGHDKATRKLKNQHEPKETESNPVHELNAKSVSSTEHTSSILVNSGKENDTQGTAQAHVALKKTNKSSKVVYSKQRHPLRVRNVIASSCNIALSKQRASAVKKASTSVKMRTVLVRKRPASSAVGKREAGLSLRKDVATSAVNKHVHTAVKKSVPPLAVKKHVVPSSVRQHVHPSAIGKSAAALSGRKGASPALRKSTAPPAAQCQSLAEFVGKFHSKTPTRFRRVPKDPGGQRQDMAFKKPTIPVTPKLATQLRSRTVSLRDQKRKEELVNVCASKPKRPKVEAVQVNTWAAPVSKLALHAKKAEENPLASNLAPNPLKTRKLAKAAASKQVSRRVTIAKSPAFALKLRSETWKQRKQMEKSTLYMPNKDEDQSQEQTKVRPEMLKHVGKNKKLDKRTVTKQIEQEVHPNRENKLLYEFHAEPAPDHRKAFCPRSKSAAVNTKPTKLTSVEDHQKSTEIEKKNVSGGRPGKSNMDETKRLNVKSSHFQAKPAPNPNRVFRPRNTSAPPTKPQAFRLASVERQQRSLQEIPKKSSHFQAKPAPNPNLVFRPRNISAPPTKPKPFRLASVERHQQSLQEFQKKKKQMEVERKKMTEFVARPVPRSLRARSNSVDPGGYVEVKQGTSGHISRPRRRC